MPAYFPKTKKKERIRGNQNQVIYGKRQHTVRELPEQGRSKRFSADHLEVG